MGLEDIGVRAVVEGMQQFRASIDEMNRKTKDYAETTALKMMFAQDKVEKFAVSIGTSSKKLGIGLAAAGAAITAGIGLITKSALELEPVKGSFENLAKVSKQSSENILQALKKASAGTVSENELMLSANRAMALGVAKNTETFSSLMEIARDRARAMGLTTTQAFDNIVTGIGRGSPLLLDNLGLMISATEANEKYAKEIGKTAEELTESERQQAMLNEVIRQGQASMDKNSQSTLTASETMQALKASISNTAAALGQAFLPIVQAGGKIIADIVNNIQEWIKNNPVLAKTITITTAVIGGLLVVIGGLILALPTLTTLVLGFGTVLQIAMGPVGWITLAIGLLTAAGIALWRNWDKVVSFFKVAWENIKIAFAYAVKFIVNTVLFPFIEYWSKIIGFITQGVGKLVGVFNQELGASIENLAEKIKNARGEISNWADNLITDSQINKAEMQAQKLAEAIGKKASEVLRRNSSTSGIGNVISEEMQKKLDEFADTAKKIGDAFTYSLTPAGRLGLTLEDIIQYLIQNGHTVEELKKKYVELGNDANAWAKAFNLNLEEVAFNLEEFYDAAKKAAEDYVDSKKDALDKEARAEDKAHQKRLDNLDEELEKTLETIDAELDAKLESYNAEIDAIDEQIDALDAADKAREDSEKKAQLESQIATEYDLKKKFELNQNLDDLILNSNNEEWQEERKLALEKMIADEGDAEIKAKLQEELNSYLNELDIMRQKTELENQKATLQSKIEEAQKEAEQEKQIAQEVYDRKVALENEAYEKFKEDIEARKATLDQELKETLERYEEDLKEFKATNQGKIEDTKKLVATINAELQKLQNKTITITEIHRIVTVGGGSTPVLAAEGGIFEPRPGGTLAVLAEAGEREYAVPESKIGGFISAMFGRLSSQTLKVAMPYWSKNNTDSHNVTYSVNANYSKSQSPISLKHDLEAIQMMARS